MDSLLPEAVSSAERTGAPPSALPPSPSRFSRFLWFCAGTDTTLLRRCPMSDWVKFEGIGGIVLATTVLAFVSSSYAFYTVFSPKLTTALQSTLHAPTAIASCVAGSVWALVIFNIDRFIVSSTGKGDGTEKITGKELLQSLPRLVMAAIIGVCISAPLEIRILKPEIDAQLELEQNHYLSELNAHAESLVQSRRAALMKKLEDGQTTLNERARYFEKRRLEINEQRKQLELEAEGKTGSGRAGRGPAWQDKRENLDKLERELDKDRIAEADKERALTAEVAATSAAMDALAMEFEAAKASNVRQSRHLDGLMKRIQISHAIGGMIPWAILLLLLAVETGPIFFKMMLTKGAYDYMVENQKRLTAAKMGIEVDAQIFLPEARQEVRVDLFHRVEAALIEERRRILSEDALAQAAHAQFRARVPLEERKEEQAKIGTDEG